MTVKDLREILDTLDPELEIVLQKDSEGNGYSPLYKFYEGHYTPYNTWSGEFSCEEATGIPAICLVPAN